MSMEILVLGGGYVGVWSARRIVRSLRGQDDARVTLVSLSDAHAFHGWTAEVLTGHVGVERAFTPLADLLPGVRLVRGAVARVDLQTRGVDVLTDAGVRTLRYDRLVIGVGSRDAHERVPGLREHGWSLKNDGALVALDAHLAEVAARAASVVDAAERARLLTVVVAGAGFTGVEASAAVAQRLRAEIAAHPPLAGVAPRVVLVGSGRELLPTLRPRFDGVADYAAEQVRQTGVEVRVGTRLAAVSADGARLDDGDVVASATVISTVGQAPVVLPGTEGLLRDGAGRLLTNRFLQVLPGVWAGGDVAAVPKPFGGTCPTSALWAIHHGLRIGGNVVRSLRGRRQLPFRFPGLGQGASFGVGRGAAELYGVSLSGWPAWLARWFFFHWFMPSRAVAWRTARDWLGRRSPASGADYSRWPVTPRKRMKTAIQPKMSANAMISSAVSEK